MDAPTQTPPACHGSTLETFPSDLQVIWVDLLTKEEFENGFGSHTPMFSGQTKCVRYYMNFKRSLKLLKEIMLKVIHPPPPSTLPRSC